jgi:hypothetical protein
MPNAWVTWVKKWAKDHDISYGCSISDIDCVAEYRLQKEDTKMKQEKKKAQKKLIPPPLYQPMDMGMPNMEPIKKNVIIKIPKKINIKIEKKRGRPVKYTTEQAKYEAKLLSNKLKRREKAKGKVLII